MASTYTLIASSTVGAGGASSIDFTSIPSTYTDLCVHLSMRVSDAGPVDTNIKFNNTDTNKSIVYLRGTGAGAGTGSYAYTIGATNGSGQTASTFTSSTVYIPNYASTSYNKSFTADTAEENNATAAYSTMIAGLWTSTAAINQLTFVANFVQYSTAYLYGVKNA
jgi:hypothetical protein